MNKRRREEDVPEQKEFPIQDEHGFGLFYVERPEDVPRVLVYLANPANAALVVLAPGIVRKGLGLPRRSKKKLIRIVRHEDLEALLRRGEFLPRHWKQIGKKETP